MIGTNAQGTPVETDMITGDTDLLLFDPWLLIKYVKYKFFELKGFDTSGVQSDFMRVFNSLTGKEWRSDSFAGASTDEPVPWAMVCTRWLVECGAAMSAFQPIRPASNKVSTVPAPTGGVERA